MFRRIVPLAVILSMLCAYIPLPARALSTASEVQMGAQYDKQIVQTNVMESDPLLNAYVQGIANKLWAQTARKDVPYNIKIIKAGDVNSFATLGGYIYVYEGLIDFTQSDDELASVIGHETGHIERRHVVTMQAKANAMGLLFGILSLFSPLIYNFGNVIEAGIMAKMSRADEIQADRTGLQLMSRAGYDPNADVTMLKHIGTLEDAHESAVDKYLEDHPGAPARIAKMVGYPELDPTQVSADTALVRALSDEERARYNIAMLELTPFAQAHPNDSEALLKLSQAELALGQTGKSEQTLAEAAQEGNAQAKADAQQHLIALRDMNERRMTLTQPNLDKLRALMADAHTAQQQAAAEIEIRRDEGRDATKTVEQRVQAVGYEIPDLSNVEIRPGSRLEALEKNLESMSRAVNSALEDSSTAIGGPGTLERGKETGLLKDGSDILHEMQAPLNSSPIPSDSIAILPSYPAMLTDMHRANIDMLRGVDAGRASLVMVDQALGDLDAFLKVFGHTHLNFMGDISPADNTELVSLMSKANDSLNAAAVSASQAAQLFNMARSRQLSVRITMLGLGTSPERYQTLQYALQQRLHLSGVSYDTMLKQDLTPGDVTAATILAADVNSTPQAIIASAKANDRPIIDEANARGMHAWPMEIFLGLTYLDYTDDPTKEMHT
jgi:predicted Zn-dependent protease